MAVAALIVAIAAVVFSAGAVLYARRATLASERLADIETARHAAETRSAAEADAAKLQADVRIAIEKNGKNDYHLVVSNHGPAKADRVAIEIVATVGEGSLPQLLSDPDRFTLHSGDRRSLMLPLAMGNAPGVECAVRWTDGRGPQDARMRASIPGL